MLPDFWDEAGSRTGRLRYACCGLVVACVFGLVACRVESHETGSVAPASEAVLVDLPPALASSAPEADQTDSPEVPPPVAASATPEVQEAPVPAADKPEAALPSPEPPHPKSEASAEQPAQAQAEPARAAQVVGGSESPAPDAPPVDSEAARRASAQAIARWQQAMVAKLEAAKKLTSARPRQKGIVEIAFAIDRQGHLVSRAVAKSSGIRTLDDLALTLVAAASPFAPPPDAMNDAALAFTIPIRFNSR